MAAAVDLDRVATAFASAASWAVPVPAGIQAGDLLICFFRSGSAFAGTVSGWTSLLSDSTDATDDFTCVFYRWAIGNETGATINFGGATKGAAIVWRITGAANPATQAPQVSTRQVFTTTANAGNAPAISPTGGSKDYLFITCLGVGGATTTGYAQPANYPAAVIVGSTGGSAATNCVIVAGSRQATTATEDAGAWTHPAANTGGTAFTIAIHPGVVIPNTPITLAATTTMVPVLSRNARNPVAVDATMPVTAALALRQPTQKVLNLPLVFTGGKVSDQAKTYAGRILSLGPLGYWRLGEPSGTTAVDSAGNFNGTHLGSVSLAQAGALSGDSNMSVLYGPSGVRTEIPADARHQSLNTFTAEAWVYPTGGASPSEYDTTVLTHLYSSSNMPVVFGYGSALNTAGSFRRIWGGFFGTAGGWKTITDPVDLVLNVWTHVALTYDGTTLRLYRNGVLVANAAASGWVAAPVSAPFYIGTKWESGVLSSFPGRLDEVALYSYALSPADVLTNYSIGNPYPARIRSLSPKAYWRLGADPLVDQSGNGNTLTAIGAPASAASLIPSDSADTSRDFNGTSQYYNAAASASTQLPITRSIEAWITPDSVSGNRCIVRKDNLTTPTSSEYLFDIDGGFGAGRLRYYYYDAGAQRGVLTPGAVVAAGVTYHLVVTDNGTTVSFYINGVLNYSAARPTAGLPASSASPVGIGAYYSGGSPWQWFDGRIDEVAIYDYALSAAAVFENYRAGVATGEYSKAVLNDGARFYYRLGEAAGTTAVDAVGTLNGTHVGSPTVGQAGALSGSGDSNFSVLYNGSSQKTDIPADTRHQTMSNFTGEAWIYPTAQASAADDEGIICHNWVGGAIPIALIYGTAGGAVSPQRVWGGFFNGSAWMRAIDPTDVPLNTWTHIAVTFDGTTIRLYRNGVQVATAAGTGWTAGPAGDVLQFGRGWGGTSYFPGRLDEIAIYPTALSATKIQQHFIAGMATGKYASTVLADAPKAYWRLGASPLVDASSNGNTLAIQGTAPSSAASLLPADLGDGSRDFVSGWYSLSDRPSLALAPPFSMEAWIVTDTVVGGLREIFDKHACYHLRTNNATVVFTYTDSTSVTRTYTSGAISAGTPYHVVATDDGTTVCIYLNGALSTSAARLGTGVRVNTDSFYIGHGQVQFDGRIDEVALYATALSAEQVRNHFIAGYVGDVYPMMTAETPPIARVFNAGLALASVMSRLAFRLRTVTATSTLTPVISDVVARFRALSATTTITPGQTVARPPTARTLAANLVFSGGGSGSDPVAISGCVLALEASDAGSGNVTLWPDRSPANNDLIVHMGVPRVITPGSVSFSTADVLKTTNVIPMDLAKPRHFFIRMRTRAAGGDFWGYGTGSTPYGRAFDLWNYNPGTLVWHGYGPGFDTISGAPAFSPDVWHTAEVSYDGTTVSVRVDDGTPKTLAAAIATTSTVMMFGRGNYAPLSDFDMSSFYAYDRVLSGAERQQVLDYVSGVSGVPMMSRVAKFPRVVAATSTVTPVMTRRVFGGRTFAAALSLGPVVVKKLFAYRTVAASTPITPLLVKNRSAPRTVAATTTIIPALVKANPFQRTVAAATTLTPALTKRLFSNRAISAPITLAPVLTKRLFANRAVAVTTPIVPTLIRKLQAYRTLAISGGGLTPVDDFNRADGAVGANYSNFGFILTLPQVIGNQGAVATDGTETAGWHNIQQFPADQEASFKLWNVAGAHFYLFLNVRMGVDDDCYLVDFAGGVNSGLLVVDLYRRAAGAWTKIGGQFGSYATAPGDEWGIQKIGGDLKIKKNGVILDTFVDSSPLTRAGYVGFGGREATGLRIDDLKAGDSVAAGGSVFTPTLSRNFKILKTAAVNVLFTPSEGHVMTPGTPPEGENFPRTIAATMTLTPVLARGQKYARAVAASAVFTPTLGRFLKSGRTMAVSLVLTPVQARLVKMWKVFSVTAPFTATQTRLTGPQRLMNVTTTLVPALSRRLSLFKTFAASGVLTPTLARRVAAGRLLAASTAITPALSRLAQRYRTFSAALVGTPSISLLSGKGKVLTASVSFSVAMKKHVAKNMAALLNFIPKIQRKSTMKLAFTVTLTPNLQGQSRFSRRFDSVALLQVGLQKGMGKGISLSVPIPFTVNMIPGRVNRIILSALVNFTALLDYMRFRARATIDILFGTRPAPAQLLAVEDPNAEETEASLT